MSATPAPVLRESFGSVHEVLARLEEPRHPEANNHSELDGQGSRWDFNLGYAGAVRLYREGWQDGAAQAEELARTLDVTPPRVDRLRFAPGVAGAFPNVPAYLAGDPESMFTPAYKSIRAPRHVTLYVPLVFNGNVPAQAALNRGVAFMALIDGLEDAGVRVHVEGYIATDIREGRKSLTTLTIKESRDPLNLEDLVFAVAHPALLRRVWFKIAETSKHLPLVKSTWASYGAARTVAREEVEDPEGNEHSANAVIFKNLTSSRVLTPTQYLRGLVAGLPEDVRELVQEGEGV